MSTLVTCDKYGILKIAPSCLDCAVYTAYRCKMYNYVLLPKVGRLAPGIITLPRKMQGIRNDDD